MRTSSKLVNNPIYITKYNTKKADWPLFQKTLQDKVQQSQYLRLNIELDNSILDKAVLELTESIITACNISIPKTSSKTSRAKLW